MFVTIKQNQASVYLCAPLNSANMVHGSRQLQRQLTKLHTTLYKHTSTAKKSTAAQHQLSC